jgi:hypothetical protein
MLNSSVNPNSPGFSDESGLFSFDVTEPTA